MKSQILLLIFLLIHLSTSYSHGQITYSFTKFSENEMPEQKSIRQIIQDTKGFMWFATWDGIWRYDGQQFLSFKNSKDEKRDYFIGNRISFMAEDQYSCLWLHTHDKHVSRYNPSTEQISVISDKELLIDNFFILDNGHTWLSTTDGKILLARTNETDKSLLLEKIYLKNIETIGKVNKIVCDSKGIEWLLTDNGLYRYDNSKLTECINKDHFYQMAETKAYLYFVSTNGRVWKFNQTSGKYSCQQLPVQSTCTTLLSLNDGRLLYGTRAQGFFLISAGGGLEHYSQERYPTMPDNDVENAYIDRKGDVWIQQRTEGVTHFCPSSNKILHLTLLNKKGKVISGGHHYQMIVEDTLGNLYIHPKGGGFALYDRGTETLHSLFNKQLTNGWRDEDIVTAICTDKQSNIWICSQTHGLEKIVRNQVQFKQYAPIELQEEQINTRALFKDNCQRIWMAFIGKGIGIFDAKKHFIGYLQANGTLAKHGVPINYNTCSITQDHEGIIWIGTRRDGLITLKENENIKNTFRINYIRHNKNNPYSISSNEIRQLKEDGQQRLWIATWNQGINYAKKNSDGSYSFINNRNELKQYPIKTGYNVRSIASDNNSNLWIGTSKGLLKCHTQFKDPSELQFKVIENHPKDRNSLINNDIQCVYPAEDGTLYIATFGGLSQSISHIKKEMKFNNYTIDNGLTSNILLSITEDTHGYIWLTTANSLMKFCPDNKTFENFYSDSFQIPTRINDGESLLLDDGTLLFNTKAGTFYCKPLDVKKSSFHPTIVFTRLQLGDHNITTGDPTGILQKCIDKTECVTLKHTQNSFSIGFAALDMNNPDYILYEYRLNGFDATWHRAKSAGEAVYTNIPHGQYTLEVRSTNSDRVWKENTRQLGIHILPSFWESPVGIALYIIASLCLLAGLITYWHLKQKMHIRQQISDWKLRFFTNISHELRTPLTLIDGPIKNILSNANLPETMRYQLQLVSRNTGRMSNLINQILDFRKLQSQEQKLHIQPIELVPFIRNLTECFQLSAQEHHINFNIHSSPENVTLWADCDKLEKIMFNLLSNAFKYTFDGSPIDIEIEKCITDIRISVQDHGMGMPNDVQKQLFKRFSSIPLPQNIEQASSGIGLSVVKELMEMHGGDVSVHSTEQGTTILLIFKKRKKLFGKETEIITSSIKEEKENSTHSMSKEEDTTISVRKTSSVLIVEDNPDLRSFLRMALNGTFYPVTEARDGEEALEKAKSDYPDIIISDIMMPKKDGLEFLRSLRKDISICHIPVILLTGKATIEDRIKGIELGADDYIAKPFSIEYLKSKMQNILVRRKMLQQYFSSTKFGSSSVPEESRQSLVNTITQNDQLFMKHLIDGIYKHIANGNLKIEELAQEVGISRPIFFNKVKKLTGMSPVEYLKNTRLKEAEKLMQTDLTISQIAFQVGFNDADYFGKCFRQKFGKSPSEYRSSSEQE